jgi:hypothetical protein
VSAACASCLPVCASTAPEGVAKPQRAAVFALCETRECDQAGFHTQSSPLDCASGDVRHKVRSAPPQWLSTADEVTA